MTSDDLTTLLLDSVPRFNAWREENLDADIDLRGADLRGANLAGATLVGAKLDGAKLDDASLLRAVLAGASLQGVSLLRADLRGAQFSPISMFNAKLMGTKMGSALNHAADLSDADLRGALALSADFSECNLEGANLEECNLEDANLHRTRLADEAARPAPPPPPGDFQGLLDKLNEEADAVKEDVARFAIFVHLTGAKDEGAGQRVGMLNAIMGELGFDQGKVNTLMPAEQVCLDDVLITPPASQWLRRTLFRLMCAIAECSSAYPHTQLYALEHFGKQYGYTRTALMRVMGQELGVELG